MQTIGVKKEDFIMNGDNKVKTTERGWAGHFVSADRCKFRRNTLLEYKDIKIVVSSVGLMVSPDGSGFEEIGVDRYFETMCFYSNLKDTRYYDIDVRRQIFPHSNWQISEINADDKANVMHDTIVAEMKGRMLSGEL